MTDAPLAEQIEYYRRRSGEYDATAYPDVPAVRRHMVEIVDGLPGAEHTLELACGTGMWTQFLAQRPGALTAVDAAPEAITIARARCPDAVEFCCVDLLNWQPSRTYDVIFFGFWLSHVPASRLPGFFAMLAAALAPGGTVVFVDEPDGRTRESGEDSAPHSEVVRRALRDGSTHRLVKVDLEPVALTARLRELGWACAVSTSEVADGQWIVGTCRRVDAQPPLIG